MWWRAIVAFLALPGVVAFAVPLLITGGGGLHAGWPLLGLVPLGLGVTLLLAGVREFYVAGRGTLAPWAPPVHLVTTGPYRYCRNPMYVALGAILLGWALLFRSGWLLAYAGGVILACHLRVRWAEEPWAARRFGDAWTRYCARTSRWGG